MSRGNSSRVTLWRFDRANPPASIGEVAASIEVDPIGHFSPDGRLVAIVGSDRSIAIWNLDKGEALGLLPSEAKRVKIRFSPDNTFVAVFAGNRGALWGLKPRTKIIDLPALSRRAQAMFSPDSKYLVAAGREADRAIQTWSTEFGDHNKLTGHSRGVKSLRFCGNTLVSQDRDQIRAWHLERSRAAAVLNANDQSEVLCGSDGERLVEYSTDSPNVSVWDIRRREARLRIAPGVARNGFPQFPTRAIKQLDTHTVGLWDVANDRQIAILPGARIGVTEGLFSQGLFSADERFLATRGPDAKTILLWNAIDGNRIAALSLTNEPYRVIFSPDGRRLVAVGDDARLWEAATGREIAVFAAQQDMVFSPDSRRLLTKVSDDAGSMAPAAKLWDASTGALISTLRTAKKSIRSILFTTDGRFAITATSDQPESEQVDTEFWKVADGTAKYLLGGHQDNLLGAVLDHSATRAITWSDRHSARLWDLETGTSLATFVRLEQEELPAPEDFRGGAQATRFWMRLKVTEVAWDFNSDHVTVTFRGLEFSDGETLTWTVFNTTQALIDRVKQVASRCLTPKERVAAGLGLEPPHWCVELSKWPYHTPEWTQWLSDSRSHRNARLPEVLDP